MLLQYDEQRPRFPGRAEASDIRVYYDSIIQLIKIILIGLALTCTASAAPASSYRLDFAGQTISSELAFSGYLILDYTVGDSQPGPMGGNYFGIVTDLSLQIGAETYVMLDNPINVAQVIDNHPNGGDIFSATIQLFIPNGEFGGLNIQFVDSSGTAFSGDALPHSLDLSDYDPFGSLEDPLTSVILPTSDGASTFEIAPLDYACLYPVPVPVALTLFTSALDLLARFRNPYA